MLMAAERSRQILGLDLIRFAAAFGVMIYHFAFCSWANPSSPARTLSETFSAYEPLKAFTDFGWIGVQLFFVISGFVISYTAEGASPLRFVRSRILRLGPGVWLSTAVTLIAVLALIHPAPTGLISETLRSVLFSPTGPWISGVYWTLGVEIVFYALVFILLTLDGFRWLEYVMIALGLASTLFWIVDLAPMHGHAVAIVHRLAKDRLGQLSLMQHGCFFAVGCLLWLTLLKRPTPLRLGALAAIGLGCVLQISAEAALTTEWMRTSVAAWPPIATWLVGIALLTGSVRLNSRLQRLYGRHASIVRQIGLYTYPLYLLHDVLGVLVLGMLLRAAGRPELALLGAVVAMLLLSALVLRGEKAMQAPVRRLLIAVEDRVTAFGGGFLMRSTRRLGMITSGAGQVLAPPEAP